MKLYEYMAKEVFARYGIPVPEGRVVWDADEAAEVARELDGPVAVKVQILAGGRGKAGGIQFADDPAGARQVASDLFGSEIRGYTVDRLLVERQLDIDGELYLGVTVDPGNRCPLIIASSRGGVSIEEVPDKDIVRREVSVEWGLFPYQARAIAEQMGLSGAPARQFVKVALALYRLFREQDAELTEINPLVLSGGEMIAADARLNIDEDSSFRHDYPDTEIRSDTEQKVVALGLSYVQLDGDVAVMANGAGETMATMDILGHYGSSAMNFLDAGGGAGVEPMTDALRILAATHPKVLLVNIFGGITRCDDVARAVIKVKEEGRLQDPLVVRLSGTNDEQGLSMLEEAGITAFRNLEEAARVAARTAGTRGEEGTDGDSD
ncbi:MAG: ADP-forming succinate--CoA ligase subunit beta [Bacillota bacterium]